MADNLTRRQRSFCMSRVRGANTALEIRFRKALWRHGLRYRLGFQLDGKPDLVFVRYKVALFVDSCFWHGCGRHGQLPRNNADFWEQKLARNKKRDRVVNRLLRRAEWGVVRVWEHDIKEDLERCVARVSASIRHRRPQ